MEESLLVVFHVMLSVISSGNVYHYIIPKLTCFLFSKEDFPNEISAVDRCSRRVRESDVKTGRGFLGLPITVNTTTRKRCVAPNRRH